MTAAIAQTVGPPDAKDELLYDKPLVRLDLKVETDRGADSI